MPAARTQHPAAWWERVPGLVVAARTDATPLYVSRDFGEVCGTADGHWLQGLDDDSRTTFLAQLASRRDFTLCLPW
ncbi:MAG TPA: hypothetical protein VNO84_03855, partial [Burkholderiaceae bacterium]|nr:hypothetical protein [Burkholderiaceae bacterium]